MDFVGERYYKLNRILLLSLGLWPYQVSTLKKTQIIFFQTLFISFLLCQCNTFLVKQHSSNCIAKIFMFIIINCVYIIKYNACLLLSDNIKYIFDRVRYDWNMLKAQSELEVIRRYADNAKLYTICFTCLITSSLLVLLTIICLPLILDVIVPMNESRPRQLVINVEYFVDEETYFFPILTHIVLNQYAGSMTVVAIATILIAYVLHACAMFKIASLANILTNSFATLYFVLIGFGLASTSLSFFNFINAVISLEKMDILVCCIVILTHLYYLFVGNYVGQNIIDDSTGICQATYNAQWYAAPLCMQKFILLIMQRSNRKSSLTAGGLFDASLEGFATLISMSVSYVMVLQSMGAHKESYEKDNSQV
ncbi:uncharacterized protein [Temnothorax longispinosus]|uniref:uncharacterized protein isoform X2 n=1 Tax=Temnothorax longispinosus TaxID=300112 RepID=UPI003A992E96